MHQFLHYSTYGRAPRKGAQQCECISGMLAEAARVPGAANHIKGSRVAPKLIFGVTPVDLEQEAWSISEEGVDLAGRRLRADAAVLVAGVASYPIERSQIEGEEMVRLERWLSSVLAWLQRTHKAQLRSVVVHMDETFVHVHFFVLPKLRRDHTLDWANAHPGLENKRFSWLHGETPVMQDRCYRVAMTRTQDDFFERVSRLYQHDRFGPRRERVGRREAAMRQRLEQERREALIEIEQQKKALAKREANLRVRIPQIQEEVMRLLAANSGRFSQVERALLKERNQALNRALDGHMASLQANGQLDNETMYLGSSRP